MLVLKRFDLFLSENGCNDSVLHVEDMKRYCAETAGLKSRTRSNYYGVIRQFSIYLHTIAPQNAVLPERILPQQPQSIRFYHLNMAQIGELMTAAGELPSKNGIRSYCIRFLIGLLYSTGLRIGEALALDLRDVDTSNSTLFVRHGKFRKERIVPMSPSTLNAMEEWIERRRHYAGNESSALLIAKRNKRLSYYQMKYAFRIICNRCGLNGDPPLRLHDFRHNYACRCIAVWRETHQDVNALLPVLANAMGHVNFFATQLYLHIDAGALQKASRKFNTHIKNTLENSK